ncbi:MAG: hypothetical protein ABI124_00300 [Terrimesophilobacter sp.]
MISAAAWLVSRTAAVFPDRFVRTFLPKRFRYRDEDVPPPPSSPGNEVRLYVGPVNWAGQGWQWARAAERNLSDVGAVSMAYHLGNEFGHAVDQSVPVGAYVASRGWQRAQREAVLSGFSHVLVEAERHPFGRVFDQTVAFQIRDVLSHGLSVAMVCHGTDIRLPSRNAAGNEYSPFRAGLLPSTPALEKAAIRNRALLDELGLPVFVSTPDLLLDVPYARWLPVVVDVKRWAMDSVPLERTIPVVVHAPSNSISKGSDLIDPIMTALDEEGIVSYRRLGNIPADQMSDAYRAADIVLDQFRLGDYGVAAVEGMSAGRVVISNVSATSRAHVRESSGRELPIVQATARELDAIVRDVVSRREHFQTQAVAGPSFAATVHDGRQSARVLAEFLGR